MRNRSTWPLLVCLAALLSLFGCGESESDRWAEAQTESSQNGQAVSEDSVEGGEFNRFFPQVEKPYDIVFKQEKTGFAQASLQQDGREVAVLSVSDTKNNSQAVEKFQGTDRTVNGYPSAAVGDKATALLVGNRFQVQIRSMDPIFGPQEREQWLTRFNLEAIARID